MFLVAIFGFATALVLSFVLTWVVRDKAVTSGMVAVPASARHIHSHPVPRIGGVAVYAAIAATIGLLYLLDVVSVISFGLNWDWVSAIVLPATLIFPAGFVR